MKIRTTLLGLALAASGAAFAQGASGIGAASSAPTLQNSIDVRAGSTGQAQARTITAPSAVMGAGADASTTVYAMPASTAVVTRSWVNIPSDAERRADFQRWQHLR